MLEVARVPEAQVQLLRTLPAWQGRLDASHTLVRELEAGRSYRFEPEHAGEIRAPTLLLLGGASPEHVKAGVEQVHQAIKGSQVAVMPGQQHVAMDTGPQLFLDAVLGFLK
jgi:pimeloyl-ACP methyl ester carboxylesterase